MSMIWSLHMALPNEEELTPVQKAWAWIGAFGAAWLLLAALVWALKSLI